MRKESKIVVRFYTWSVPPYELLSLDLAMKLYPGKLKLFPVSFVVHASVTAIIGICNGI